jgi:hypothetical protein
VVVAIAIAVGVLRARRTAARTTTPTDRQATDTAEP